MHYAHSLQPIENSILRSKKRRSSNGSQSPTNPSPSEYVSRHLCRSYSDLLLSIAARFSRKDGKGTAVWNRVLNPRQTGNFPHALTMASLRPACSPKHEAMPTQEDHRTRFFEEYREVAKEYDKEFLKKHDEDLNTTLIFVSFLWVFPQSVLTKDIGWFILRSHLRLYHPVRLPATTRS